MSKDKFTIGDTVTSRITHNDYTVVEISGSQVLCRSASGFCGVLVLLEAANLKLVKEGE